MPRRSEITMKHINICEIEWLQSAQADERAGSFRNPLVDIPKGFTDGWDIGQGAIVCRKADTKTQKLLVAQRNAYISEHMKDEKSKYVLVQGATDETSVYANGKQIAEMAELLWKDKDGKMIVPTYQGIPCNRRGYALPASQLAYGVGHKGKTFQVPVEVMDISSDEDMFLIRMRENSNIGRSNYTLADLVGCALQGVKFGHTETQIRNELNLGRGRSQTVHGLATLCKKYPGLNLLSRLQMEKPKNAKGKPILTYKAGSWINISAFDGNANRTLLGKAGKTASGASSLDDMAVKAMGFKTKEEAVGKVATEQQIETFIKLTIGGKVNADAIMAKPRIEQFKDSTNGLLSEVFNAILENSPAKMAATIAKIEAVLNK